MVAQVKHDVPGSDAPSRPALPAGYEPGGDVAQLYSELARRLADQEPAQLPALGERPGERIVRRLSVAGGFVSLGAGYAVATALILRLF